MLRTLKQTSTDKGQIKWILTCCFNLGTIHHLISSMSFTFTSFGQFWFVQFLFFGCVFVADLGQVGTILIRDWILVASTEIRSVFIFGLLH
jgi:hypothetical protein